MFHDGLMGEMWFGWIFWLVILVVIIWVIINQLNKNKQNSQIPQSESALDILKKRYAKGEITKEHYEQMKNDLK